MMYYNLSFLRHIKTHCRYFIFCMLPCLSLIALNAQGVRLNEVAEQMRAVTGKAKEIEPPPRQTTVYTTVSKQSNTEASKPSNKIQTKVGIENLGQTCFFNGLMVATVGGLKPDGIIKLLPTETDIEENRQRLINYFTDFSTYFSSTMQESPDLGASLKETAWQFQKTFNTFAKNCPETTFQFNNKQQDPEEFIQKLFEVILKINNKSANGKNIKVYMRTLTHHYLSKDGYSEQCDFTTTTEELYNPVILEVNAPDSIEKLLHKFQSRTEELRELRVDLKKFDEAMSKKTEKDRPLPTDPVYNKLNKGPLKDVKNKREVRLSAHLNDLTHMFVMPRPSKFDAANQREVKLEQKELMAVNDSDTINVVLLDLDNDSKPTPVKFRRVAITAHTGATPYGGHYKAFVRTGEGNEWHQFDDDKVSGSRRLNDFDKNPTLFHYVNIYERVEGI